MQIDKYTAMKSKGLCKLIKVGPDHVVLTTPQYDQNTGERLSQPNFENFSLEAIDKNITELEGNVTSLKEFRKDVADAIAAKTA